MARKQYKSTAGLREPLRTAPKPPSKVEPSPPKTAAATGKVKNLIDMSNAEFLVEMSRRYPNYQADPRFPVITFNELLEEITSGIYKSFPVTLFPPVLTEILKINLNNRPPSDSTIQRYCDQFAEIEGHWFSRNGQTIAFSEDGDMIDGQHRGMGAIKADVPLQTLIAVGCDRRAFEVIDQGYHRSPRNTLEVAHRAYPKILPQAARHVLNFRNRTIGRTIVIAPSRILEIIDSFTVDEENSLENSARKTDIKDLIVMCPHTILAACHYAFRQAIHQDVRQPEDVDRFFRDLSRWQVLPNQDRSPVARLGDLLTKRRKDKRRDYYTLIGLICKAWRYRVNNETTSLLTFKDGDAFPYPPGLERWSGLEG
jgi:hypothetical protein